VRTAVAQFGPKFGGELSLQLLQLADFGFGLDYLLVMVWTILLALAWCAILGDKGALPFVWLSSLGFASEMILCQG
jgi:hypothetical protein